MIRRSRQLLSALLFDDDDVVERDFGFLVVVFCKQYEAQFHNHHETRSSRVACPPGSPRVSQ